LKDGVPHHGHITLCSYRWWTDFFLSNGWVRAIDFELKAARAFGPVLRRYNWQPYLMERLLPESLSVDVAVTNQLGAGWHEAEHQTRRLPGRWTNGRGEIYVRSAGKWKSVEIAFSAPSGNVVRDYTLSVLIERQVVTDQYEIRWEPIFSSLPVAVLERERPDTAKIDVVWPAAEDPRGDSAVLRLTLVSPAFCPQDYGLSVDSRTLGLFVHKVVISDQ
jgi:hypothetical protein